jgi:tripartite-type tricarboxylate transporter receptor subunit TctC
VPFKGGTQGVTEVMANRVDVDIETITLVQPFIASGKLRGIAVTSRTPVAALPGVPTASQTFRGMEYESWLGVAAPARTPQAIVNKLNGELRKVLALPEVQTKFKQMGAEAHPSSPDEFRSMVLDDIAKFSSIVDARKLPRE